MPTLDSAAPSATWPLRVRTRKPVRTAAIRTIRIGILGLGQVGQAVARLAADRAATAHAGWRFHVEQALVRDVEKVRHCPTPSRITSNPSAFLRGHYDVVIEALGAVEPARTLVSRLLGRGTSVVTANKALVAAHLEHLESIAAARGAAFRYEATALSAVPFLGTLAARPLVASVDRLLAIVNGTSNYLLTSLADPGTSFDQALSRAQALGYAEPDASRDLDGLDAADKLLLLTSLFGWGRLSREALDVDGIRRVTADDLAAARSIGGTIKPVAFAQRDTKNVEYGPKSRIQHPAVERGAWARIQHPEVEIGAWARIQHPGVSAFVGPAFLPSTDPLASLGGALNGIRLDGRHVSNLFFSGPGAGPDVTAATLLDDAIQAASSERQVYERPRTTARPVFPSSPVTSWFLRTTLPGVLPPASALASLAAMAGLPVVRVADYTSHNSRWLVTGPQSRRAVDAAIEKLSNTHRIEAAAFRRF